MSKEILFPDEQFIISKTDRNGKILYGNELFVNVSGYDESELINKPHSILRHPDMPKIIFKILWDTIQNGHEIFAFVKNKAKNGDYYWVLAFVTPSYDQNNQLIEYFSVRRAPDKHAIKNIIEPLYRDLLMAEKSGGMQASEKRLNQILQEKGISYEQFVFSL